MARFIFIYLDLKPAARRSKALRLLGFLKTQALVVNSAIEIWLWPPLESPWCTYLILLSRLHEGWALKWGRGCISSHPTTPNQGWRSTVLWEKRGPTFRFPQKSYSWPALNPSQPEVGQTSEPLLAVPPLRSLPFQFLMTYKVIMLWKLRRYRVRKS